MSAITDEARPALRWVGIAIMLAGAVVAGWTIAKATAPECPPPNITIDPARVPVLPAMWTETITSSAPSVALRAQLVRRQADSSQKAPAGHPTFRGWRGLGSPGVWLAAFHFGPAFGGHDHQRSAAKSADMTSAMFSPVIR